MHFNDTFVFFVGHWKRLEISREIKIPEVYLKELKQDYPNCGLTYLYEYHYINSSRDKWSIDNIIGPKKTNQRKFYKGHFK